MTYSRKSNPIKYVIAFVIFVLSASSHAFLVSDTAGKRVDILDHVGDGRWTVIMLWQLECAPCEIHKPAMESFHNQYKNTAAHVVGLILDGHEFMPEIKSFVDKKPTAFPSYVVFSDVFRQQLKKESGKYFNTSPGYLIYSPAGELKMAITHLVDINKLIDYLEDQIET